MKKIININLAGRVIPIEDSAYESLQRYIESLRRYFASEELRDEINNDIESRIAELMNDKIKRGATSVTDEDIEEIIASMGRVEDFAASEETSADNSGSATGGQNFEFGEQKRPRGRLYRDLSDKFIGGVCSGIANYMNVDPAVIRLLFAIITFGGFGFGFLLYIFLWIFLPARGLDSYVGKRLFRNPDDQIIGGVCGGLAAYFNWNSKTIRLVFAAPLLLNIFLSLLNALFSMSHYDINPIDIAFGSITSTFILIYIVLWIVLPLANSPFEKMEMRGEKVDVNRIKQNVQENMGDFKTRMQNWGEEVKDSANRFSQRAKDFTETRGKSFASEAKPVATGIGHAIGVLIKAFFLFIFGSIAFALFVGLMVLIFGGGTVLWPLKEAVMDFVLDGFWQKAFFWGTMIFFLAVPIIAFLTWLIRRIMKVRSQKSYLGWIFGGLWTIGWVSFVLFISSLARDFRSTENETVVVPVTQPYNGRMLITVSEDPIRYSGDLFFVDADNNGWDFSDDSLKLANIKLQFEASKDSNYHVSIVKESRGRNYTQAGNLASRIRYHAVSRDSVLDLGAGYAISRSDKFRGQEVFVVIEIPAGKKITFDESVADKLNPFHFEVRRRRKGFDVRFDDRYNFWYQAGVDYTMTANGDLLTDVDLQKKAAEERQGVQTQTTTPRSQDSIDKVLEEERRKREESDRKIRQLEDMKNQRTGHKPNMDGATSMLFVPTPFI